ncbi:response regulator [Hahella sp. CR1]|uniref:response regulator n=1 Tax=Hahella sp. CR1 TaxID=2992807 RepID=UPI0024420970|nr:response regulator [Hahella sp. CR1]MDG9668553.1 response regulator [Hahella sp. CR1]
MTENQTNFPTPIKLLLVEDDEDDYIIAKDLLEQIAPSQFELDWASNAEIARAALARDEHHVCLMDYRLGPDDGLMLLREAPKLGFHGPIIMLTGQDDSRLDADALRGGAVDYLVKSDLNSAHLARSIRYALARREMETERLERLKAEAENRSKSEFLAHLSHELRTPLTAILGYTELLIAQDNAPDNLSYLQIVQRNGQHLLSLLNDILDISKIEAGKLEMEFVRVNLQAFLADLYSLMAVSAQDKNLHLSFIADSPLPENIETDPIRLRQILLNLIGNAIKFTEQGEVTVRVQMVKEEEQEKVQFKVLDTGPGISLADQKRLFQPFTQVYANSMRRGEGAGLGLAISRQLAHRLGGDIRLSSRPGEGSDFTAIVKPGPLEGVKRIQPDLETGGAAEPHATRTHQVQGHLLVADDLPDIRRLIGHLVESAGARVSYAQNGAEAVRIVSEAAQSDSPIDLVIMDMHMPVLDGHSATRELRRRGHETPVLALTAATMRGERERCLASGCTDHLSKPVNVSQLFTLIERHLPNTQTKSPSLLLVEDNADASAATAALLEHLGWRVHCAANGAEALQMAERIKPSAVVLDLNLPDTDGYSLARRIRDQGLTEARLIALSGYAEDKRRSSEAGFQHHLMKPVSLGELTAVLPAKNSL